MTVANVRLRPRTDTAANWTAANPILADSEIAFERDTKRFKLGDGVTDWAGLPYWVATGTVASGSVVVATRADLALLNGFSVGAAFLNEGKRAGTFAWDPADHTADVLADPAQGIYVPPDASTGLATDGSDGAWVRVLS